MIKVPIGKVRMGGLEQFLIVKISAYRLVSCFSVSRKSSLRFVGATPYSIVHGYWLCPLGNPSALVILLAHMQRGHWKSCLLRSLGVGSETM